MTPEQRQAIKRIDMSLCRVSVLADIAETKAVRALGKQPKPAKDIPRWAVAVVAVELSHIGSRA